MILEEICHELSAEALTARSKLVREVTGGYASDLLSCVMSKAQAGNVWVTLQGHANIVAVASLLNLAGIIITEGVDPDEATRAKAEEEGIPLLKTPLTTFAVVSKLAQLSLHGVD